MASVSDREEWEHEKVERAIEQTKRIARADTLAREVERYLDSPGCNAPAQATAQARLRWALEQYRA